MFIQSLVTRKAIYNCLGFNMIERQEGNTETPLFHLLKANLITHIASGRNLVKKNVTAS